MSKAKFNFSKQLKADLKANGKDWETLLFKACLEGKAKEVKATLFCTVLRASGFKCGTGPARTAYKTVRDGKSLKDMAAAITAVKAKRKSAGKDGAGKAGAGKDGAGKAGAGKDGAGTDTGTDTLVGVLTNAVNAAGRGNLVVCETWLVKAQAMLETAKTATAQAIEKMGGVA